MLATSFSLTKRENLFHRHILLTLTTMSVAIASANALALTSDWLKRYCASARWRLLRVAFWRSSGQSPQRLMSHSNPTKEPRFSGPAV